MPISKTTSGINASIELIHRTRGGPWPAEPVTKSSTSSIWSGTNASSAKATRSGTPCTKSATIPGMLLPLSDGSPHAPHARTARPRCRRQLVGHADAYRGGYYAKLHAALRGWINRRSRSLTPYYSNLEIPSLPT